MSGGKKETLRQKMIGMMYIVLTALMAMNVSSSVLERFAILSNKLELSSKSIYNFTTEVINNIKFMASEMGNRVADVVVLEKVVKIRKLTDDVNLCIDNIKQELLSKVGGIDPLTGFPKDLKSDGQVSFIMLNKQKAIELKNMVNKYAEDITKISGFQCNHFALDADENLFFKNNPNQKGKSFGELNFAHTPMSCAIATINLLQNEINTIENEVVSKMAKNLGADDVKFDKFKLVVKPKSRVLVAGTKYEADLFLAASSSAVKPNMFVNGTKIGVNNEGVGVISFPVVAKQYDKEGISNQSFKASISLNIAGKETQINEIVNYSVIQPVLEVQASAIQALYYNCGNELNIKCPSLGSEYNPSFSAVGAELFKSSKRGIVTVVPNNKEVILTVLNNGINVGTLKYNVRPIPRPSIVLLANGKVINEKEGMQFPGPQLLEIRVIPDEGFSQILPNEARYKVSEWKVTLARGSRAVSEKAFNGRSKVSVSNFADLAKPGDRLVIEIINVVRTNFNNKEEVVAMPSIYKIITLN